MADPGIQPPYLDPSQYPAYLDLQRKQMLAQMLTQTAQQSAQTPTEWNSMRVVPRRSPLANVTTLASALMAGKAMQGANQAQQNYFQGLMGGGPSSATAAAPAAQAAPPPTAPGLLPPNGIPGSQGPPGPAPAGLVAPPAVAPPTPPPARNPMIPEGMSPSTANGLLQMMGPAEYGKSFVAPQFQPTDLEKTMRAAGIDPGSTLGRQIMQQAVAKANYIAPTAARPGTVLVDENGQPKFFNPNTAEGSMPQFGPNGMPTSIAPIPGGAAATATAAAEKTAGTVSQTPQKVGVDAQGRDVYVYPTPPALSGHASPGVSGAAAGPIPAGGGQTASAATIESQKAGGQSGQAYASELSKNATGATEVRRSLSELKNLANQATPGAMNEGKMKLGSYMIAAGVSPETAASWLGVNVGALQAAQKQTATLAVNTIHSMTSRGTNFDLETFMRNNPNMNMSDPSAFQRVVDYMDNKSKQEIAKQKDFVNWKKGVSPDDWESGHTAHWLEQQNQNIDAGRSNSRPPLSSFVRP